MRQRWLLATVLVALVACSESPTNPAIERTLFDGQHIFRFDTFGDEAFWTDTLKMHQVVQGISPKTALGVGLKVDVDALPAALVSQLQAGQGNRDDPARTPCSLRGVPASTTRTGITTTRTGQCLSHPRTASRA